MGETVGIKYDAKQWVVLAATGPTLTWDQVDVVARYRHLVALHGCNDAYKMFPDLNVHYACDPEWWAKHAHLCKTLPAEKWTQDEGAAREHGLHWVQGEFCDGLSRDPKKIHFGNNSGYQQLNLAYLMGARRILLVGYNMTNVGGQKHFFGDHPVGLRKCSDYTQFAPVFGTVRCADLGLEVINCTPQSAVKAFPLGDLETCLERIRKGKPAL